MCGSEVLPSSGVLEAVRGLAGPWAAIVNVARLEGGQHADTWRVDTKRPALSVVVREFPVGDPAGAHEQLVLRCSTGSGDWRLCCSTASSTAGGQIAPRR